MHTTANPHECLKLDGIITEGMAHPLGHHHFQSSLNLNQLCLWSLSLYRSSTYSFMMPSWRRACVGRRPSLWTSSPWLTKRCCGWILRATLHSFERSSRSLFLSFSHIVFEFSPTWWSWDLIGAKSHMTVHLKHYISSDWLWLCHIAKQFHIQWRQIEMLRNHQSEPTVFCSKHFKSFPKMSFVWKYYGGKYCTRHRHCLWCLKIWLKNINIELGVWVYMNVSLKVTVFRKVLMAFFPPHTSV